MTKISTLTSTFLGLVLLSPATAQKTKTKKNPSLGVQYKIPKSLQQIPINPVKDSPHLKDRWSATKKPLYGRGGAYVWGVKIFQFFPKGLKGNGAITEGDSGGTKEKPRKTNQLERMRAMSRFPDFKTFILESPRYRVKIFEVKGQSKKQRSGDKLTYKFYRWVSASGGNGWIHEAGVYQVGNQEIALLVHYPEEFKKKLAHTIRSVVQSLKVLKKIKKERDQKIPGEEFVQLDPKLRRPLLDKAVLSIKNLKEWDIFATKHFIVLYSAEAKRKAKARAFAHHIASRMDEMHDVYEKYFPPHKKMKKWWSVLRICRDGQEFGRYGGTSGGVIGWFNPLSKELVIFNGKGRFSVETVAYHEGWHQYAHFWFPGAHLHRWFDEGHGDFFGSMVRKGKKRWVPAKSKMRTANIKSLVATKKFVPVNAIVRWHTDKFYGPGAANYYAEGWAIVDFLRRGRKTAFWNKKWNRILPTYIKVALETKDTDKAIEEAFKGVDWEKFQASWIKYVKKGL
jgi:hypothetical protein